MTCWPTIPAGRPSGPGWGSRRGWPTRNWSPLTVISALLGYGDEPRFVRFAEAHLRRWFPYVPSRDGCNKRLRGAAGTIARVISALARECASWHDDVWLVDSAPVECGTSRETAKRSGLADWAEHGWCASHSRWFWWLRLHLIATPSGLPVCFALVGAKADEREVCAAMIDRAGLARPGQTLTADKGYRSQDFETGLDSAGISVPRPATRLLALTAANWHNQTTHRPRPTRSLVAYDH